MRLRRLAQTQIGAKSVLRIQRCRVGERTPWKRSWNKELHYLDVGHDDIEHSCLALLRLYSANELVVDSDLIVGLVDSRSLRP